MNSSNIPFSILSIEATLDLSTRCRDLIVERHSTNAELILAAEALNTPIEQATLAIASSRKQELTQKLNEADRKRDRRIIGFRKAIEAYLYEELNPDARQAAENLMKIFRKHGTQMYLEAMSVQSSLMTSLFEDLDTASAKADLATLKLTDWLDGLKNLQAAFVALQNERDKLEIDKNVPTKQKAKSALVEKLSLLLKGLDFLISLKPDIYAKTGERVIKMTDRLIQSER